MPGLPRFEPMLATTGPIPTDRAGVAIEPKLDGFRCLAYLNDPGGPPLRAYSRSGRLFTETVPELAPLASELGVDVVLDGELIVTDDTGRPDFYALSRRMLATSTSPLPHLRRRAQVTFVAFDVLWLDGRPLVGQPYSRRRSYLEELALAGPCWTTLPSFQGIPPEQVLAACDTLGLEGCVAKGVSSVYDSRRSRAWVKRKTVAWVSEHAPRRRPGGRAKAS